MQPHQLSKVQQVPTKAEEEAVAEIKEGQNSLLFYFSAV
jgi:hypothetical protein